jgi:DmsE family decaheme c-type cytochrome
MAPAPQTKLKVRKGANMVRIGQWLASCAATAVFAIAGTCGAADAPAAAAGGVAERALAKDAVCTKCHDENETKPILAIYQTRHGVKGDVRTPGCQTCHGASDLHVRNPQGTKERPLPDVVFGPKSKTPVDERNGACLMCHKSGPRTYWTGSTHEYRSLACATCHTIHAPRDPVLTKITHPDVCFGCHKTQRSQIHQISTHPIEIGKVACSDCHNPHGSTAPKLMVKDTVNETCYTCHADKRGPFLWEHSPVVDDCANCHNPHGSTKPALLKARVPWLCQECHSGDHGAAINSGANLPTGSATTVNGLQGLANQSPRAQTNARACLNCHVLIHGSNHPAGAKFQR